MHLKRFCHCATACLAALVILLISLDSTLPAAGYCGRTEGPLTPEGVSAFYQAGYSPDMVNRLGTPAASLDRTFHGELLTTAQPSPPVSESADRSTMRLTIFMAAGLVVLLVVMIVVVIKILGKFKNMG